MKTLNNTYCRLTAVNHLPQTMARPQLNVLITLDVARTQWYHFRAIVIAGMGFFTDAYDLFSISLLIHCRHGRILQSSHGAPAEKTVAGFW